LKKLLTLLIAFMSFSTFCQNTALIKIETKVTAIENATNLIETVADWSELIGQSTDGGGTITIWKSGETIVKISEAVGVSRGRYQSTIYLDNGTPIKITESEALFAFEDGDLNYEKLETSFTATLYIFDWQNDNFLIERNGKRFISETQFSAADYQPILDRAKLVD
jgi:hypothetical protein